MRRVLTVLIAIALLLGGTWTPVSASGATAVSISGDDFKINGSFTYPGRTVEGLLLNSRMINGAFNDLNTSNDWSYPDTGVWDPQRNTDEFTAKMPNYASNGLNMVTVGLQGGCPWPDGTCDTVTRDEIVSAFNANGTLRAQWMSRVGQIISSADTNGIVVDLSLFYGFQDQVVSSDANVEAGAKAVLDWIATNGYTNVLLEVCNECNVSEYDHANLEPSGSLASLTSTLNAYSSVPVSASFTGGYANNHNISSAQFSAMDFVTVHCNSQTTTVIDSEVAWIRTQTTKPVMFNECGTDTAKMDAAVDTTTHASWGYYDQGPGGYAAAGFQAVPAKWGPRTTPTKSAFFDAVKAYAGL